MADASQLATTLLGLQPRKINPLSQQYKYGSNLMEQGSSTAPVRSPLEGIARALQGALGGWVAHDANEQQTAQDTGTISSLRDLAGAKDQADFNVKLRGVKGDPELLAPLLAQVVGQRQQQFGLAEAAGRLGAGAPGGAPPQAPGGAASAIGGIESGGQPNGGYGAVGPVANSQGNRAYGKYQVLDSNIGPWTQEVLGKAMSPQEFLANPDAQNKVFETKFGQYVTQYGSPQAASKAWFAGPNGMNNPGASDVNGMTVAKYGDNFDKTMGGQPQPGAATAPAVPNVPRPQPSPDILARVKQDLASGAYGTGPEAMAKANAALNAEVDKQWGVDRENAKMGFEQKSNDYRANRDSALKQPQETATNEHLLRTEFDNQQPVKDYRKAATIFDNAVKSYKTNTAAADLNLVYSFATMMDPGSVVREGEMGMVQATQNAPERIKALVASVSGGGRIAPDARESLMEQMSNRYQAYKQTHDQLAEAFGGIADRSGMSRQNIVAGLPEVKYEPATKLQPGGGGQVSGGVSEGATATNPQTGQKIVFRGGQWTPAQ